MRQSRTVDPGRFASVCAKHPVLHDKKLKARSRREIPISQLKDRSRYAVENRLWAGSGVELP